MTQQQQKVTESDSHERVDWALLEKKYASSPGLLDRLAGQIIATRRSAPQELRSLASQGDYPALARLAHKLASEAGIFSVESLLELARQVEQAARERHVDAGGLADRLAARVALWVADIEQRSAA